MWRRICNSQTWVRLTRAAAAAVVGCAATVQLAQGVPTVTVGYHQLMAGTPGQRIPILVSGGDPVAGVNLLVQLADGGVALGGTGNAPAVTDVDLTGPGTIFSANNTGRAFDDPPTPQLWQVHTTTAAGTVPAAGTLAYVTVDATGYGAGNSYALRLGHIATDPSLNSDFGGTAATIHNGSVVLVSDPTWNVDRDGTWASGADWVGGAAPGGAGIAAGFRRKITAPRTVTLEGPVTVGRITFDSPAAGYTLAGGAAAPLILDGAGSKVDVVSGSHVIGAPVSPAADVAVITSANSRLSLTAGLSVAPGSAGTVTKSGAGVLEVRHFRTTGMLTVSGGSVRLIPDGTSTGTSRVGGVSISGGHIDVASNWLVVDYAGGSASPAEVIRGYLQSGRKGGGWDGTTGITSSTAAADPTARMAVGYGEASTLLRLDGAGTFWGGAPVDATSLLLKSTWYGDATLDGRVDADDLVRVDRGRTMGLAGWINGDFNYDGTVDAADYLLIDRNLILSGVLQPDGLLAARTRQFGPAYVGVLVASLPEPGTLPVIAAGCIASSRRRRHM